MYSSNSRTYFSCAQRNLQPPQGIYRIQEIACDRWTTSQLVTHSMHDGATTVPFGQGYQSMNAPTKELLTLVTGRRLSVRCVSGRLLQLFRRVSFAWNQNGTKFPESNLAI
jgi:hypothetical protein